MAIKDEYRKTQARLMESYLSRFDTRQHRGKMYANLTVNAEFRGGILTFEEVSIRHATPCEVMLWMVTHQQDMLTLEDNEYLVTLMEVFV